jgi:exonuclease SbcC
MKPLRIEIHDFGAITYTVIDLSNVTLAAICGPNGAGKSTAFTIAPMFALFGTTKSGTRADDMVRTGTKEAGVTFDFDHQGDTWRVIRTRSTKGSGKTTLELQLKSGELWTSESGASIAETQKKIIDLLNLDAETFSASSMILQGKANEFTSRPAGQRKAILAQILQLEQYETLQEKAKGKTDETILSLEKIKSKVADIDVRLDAKISLESEKFIVEIEKACIDKSIKIQEVDLQSAQVDHNVLLAKLQQADEIDKRAKGLRLDVGVKALERDQQQARLLAANKLLGQEKNIIDQAVAYEQAREQVIVLRTKKDQQDSLYEEGRRLKDSFNTIEASLVLIVPDIASKEKLLADRSRLEKASLDYKNTLVNLEKLDLQHKEYIQLSALLTERQNDLHNAQSQFENDREAKILEIDLLKSKSAMLASANCVDIENAKCRFLADAKAAKGKIPGLTQALSTWVAEQEQSIIILTEFAAAAQKAIDKNGYNQAEHTEKILLSRKLKPDADQFSLLSGLIELLKNLKAQRTDLLSRRADIDTRLQSIRHQYKDLSEGVKLLPELEAKLLQLEPYLKQKERLPAAKEIAKTAQETIDKLASEIEKATAQAVELEKEYAALIGDSKSLEAAAAAKVKTAQDALKQSRDKQTILVAKMGGIQSKLDGLAQDEEQRKLLVAEMDPLAKELTRWQKLVKAFGRNGIPALIIENAVPELERIANDILGQMTGGKNFLKFETQKELKSRSGMAETLDIIVGDWAGERIYETFSGGEQLRIDFAIRFALAELLARRAGAKVDWLTIDEGFGSQSEEYLPAVIDAVKSVASRFGMVLVISHVKAVQEAFEQQIIFKPSTDDDPVEVLVA